MNTITRTRNGLIATVLAVAGFVTVAAPALNTATSDSIAVSQEAGRTRP